MSQETEAFNDLARIKGKKTLTKGDIDLIKQHLADLKNVYLNYKLNVEVLTRQFDKQVLNEIQGKFQPDYDRQRPVDEIKP